MLKKSVSFVMALILSAGAAVNTQAQQKDIVDTAAGLDTFSTLVAAVKAGDLVNTLKSSGPFTVFAPTNDAFAKLPEGTVESLLKPENKDKLVAILTYHVVPGKVLAKDVVGLKSAKTAQGQEISIRASNSGVMINNAKVVKTDVMCTNGVIHVIDNVILPPEKPADIVDTAVGAGSFKTLVAAVKAAGLVETLKGEGPFTVFAPTDEAFAKLPKGTIESLLKPENKSKLVDILTYHVVSGNVMAKDVVNLTSAKTVQGSKVNIKVNNNNVMINNAKVVKTDIVCGNGVIHVIDTVIMPPAKTGAVNPRQMIEQAVATGAPLYNQGHAGQCADIYASTISTLVNDHGSNMPCSIRNHMMTTLNQANGIQSDTERAWHLRRGLDNAYTNMPATMNR